MGHESKEHNHSHGAPQSFAAAGAENGSRERLAALLEYMVHHNEHHTEELADLLDSLPESLKGDMLSAIGSFEAANVELSQVLDRLKEAE